MRTMSIVALMTVALSGCGGTQESVHEPEQAGAEVQAERGEAEGTPGIDEAVDLEGDCWVAGEEGEEGTPGYDANADSYECMSSETIESQAESDMP